MRPGSRPSRARLSETLMVVHPAKPEARPWKLGHGSRTVRSLPLCGPGAGGGQERDVAEVHPDECRACSRFDWWGPESQS